MNNDFLLHAATSVALFVGVFGILYLAVRLSRADEKLSATEEALDAAVRQCDFRDAEVSRWRGLFGPFPSLFENSPERRPGIDPNDKTIAIDLDGVIFEYVEPWTGLTHFGRLMPGAVESMKKLKSLGYTLVVHTTRNNTLACHNRGANSLELTALVQDQLEKHGVPYDYISTFKPLARYYIDDRAVQFTSWGATMRNLGEQEKNRLHIKASKIVISLLYPGKV